MDQDAVDLFVEQWSRERPDLDSTALGIVSRVIMLAKHFEQSADRALEQYGLSLWQFDVLAALRRSGPPFKLSPTRLTQLVTLTSGAMTNRIDRLEELGLVQRQDDPEDRRGLLIALTAEGKKLVDSAIVTRLDAARGNVDVLSRTAAKQLVALLRTLMLENAASAPSRKPRSAE